MQTAPQHLDFEAAASLVAAISDTPEHQRQRIGGMEYLSANVDGQNIAVCVDLITGEGLRFH